MYAGRCVTYFRFHFDDMEHKLLADFIKGVHSDLRRELSVGERSLDEIWGKHCENETVLKQYADCMYKLATEHWTSQPQTRIEWCRDAVREYYNDGGLQRCLDKDRKRMQWRKIGGENSAEEEKEKTNIDETAVKDETSETSFQCRRLGSFAQGKLYLLDVGSCYNPFSEFEEFISIGIDLCPANEKVHRCDFTNIQIDRELSMGNFVHITSTPDHQLVSFPHGAFDVVVFSLLLEYLPAPKQRWLCCTNAFELLKTNGLFIIISPDSHKQHRNAAMIKSWKTCIEAMGFCRWKYEKLEHIHCMVFRKVKSDVEIGDEDGHYSNMMFIHQDFLREDSGKERTFTEKDEENFLENLHELPSCIDDDTEELIDS
ncbi:hypothetical protein FSP39_022514 [Pinctada imbricata]|uniref:S-adenosylmethionine sensor upstream of mTORC1 n=1 Tax=Pinctada imbricata TaxID=66713 RepID=A0AA88YEI0_PINIB|nr:hypothetical protein FSP39_022514 [Pinctada imbricata]